MRASDVTAVHVLAALMQGPADVAELAARLNVPWTAATLRHTLFRLCKNGTIRVDDTSGSRIFTLNPDGSIG